MRLYFTLAAAITAASLLTACGAQGTLPGTQSPFAASLFSADKATTNAIKNGCFTGLTSWKEIKGEGADKSNPASGSVKIMSGGYSNCKHAAFAGTTKPPAPNGFWGVSQTVKVPKNGKLTWWFWGASDDMIQYGQQEVNIVDGKKSTSCYKKLVTNSSKDWKEGTCSLKSYAGKNVTIELGVFDNGYSKTYDDWYISDVSVT